MGGERWEAGRNGFCLAHAMLLKHGMKYVVLLLGVVAVYWFLIRSAPVAPVVQAVTASEVAPLTSGPRAPAAPAPAGSNALKRPIDRTHAVLDQVKQRNGNGEF